MVLDVLEVGRRLADDEELVDEVERVLVARGRRERRDLEVRDAEAVPVLDELELVDRVDEALAVGVEGPGVGRDLPRREADGLAGLDPVAAVLVLAARLEQRVAAEADREVAALDGLADRRVRPRRAVGVVRVDPLDLAARRAVAWAAKG